MGGHSSNTWPKRKRFGLKKYLITAAKFAISLAILGYLFHQTRKDPAAFQEFWKEPKNWKLLVFAFLIMLTCHVASFLRWRLLVRALHIPFSVRDALRLGFLGCLFNSLSLGPAGGDLVKAIYVAQEQKGRRTEAIATIVIDRLVGLYAMFLLATISTLNLDWGGLKVSDPADLGEFQYFCHITVGVTVAGTVIMMILLLPGLMTASWWDHIFRWPIIGSTIERILNALRTFRSKLDVLAAALLISLGLHSMVSTAIYLVARGMPGETPTLATFFVMVPIVNAANAIPVPGGLGAFELFMDLAYRCVAPPGIPAQQGLLVALGYRLIITLIALIGIVYWFVGRKELAKIADKAEQEQPTVR